MIAHFVVSTVNFCMIAMCGEVIGPRSFTSATVGIKSEDVKVCTDCKDKADKAWVTFIGVK